MSDVTRRRFAETLALALAAPFVLEDLPAPGTAEAVPSQGQDREPSALAKTLAESIRLRYPDRLSADDLGTVARAIDGRLRSLERLYRVELANSDEPDFVFSVYRGED